MPQNPIPGYVAKNPAGALAPLQGDAEGFLLTSDAHGNLYHQAFSGNLFSGANTAGVTTSAGLATTCVGLILSNPAGNTKNLVLRHVSAALIVAPATVTALVLITGYLAAGITVHTTPLTPASTLIGGSATPTAKLDSAATLVGSPAYTMILGQTASATALLAFLTDLQGSIIIPPGGYAALGTTIASPSSGFLGSFEWEEVAVTG